MDKGATTLNVACMLAFMQETQEHLGVHPPV